MPASQHSESQTLSSHCTIWVENSSGMNHGSRILNSHCKGQRTTAMRYHTSLIKLPDIYQPEYRPWQRQGKKKSKRSFSENHCWWTQSLRYNYKTTLSLSKAFRISPLRFFSKPSQIQWLIKQFQRTIILGCDSHDCELWWTPNHQDNFYMNMWSCIVCVCRGVGGHCWASREAWDVITFLCLYGFDHVYHELRASPSPSWASVFWSVKWGHWCWPFWRLGKMVLNYHLPSCGGWQKVRHYKGSKRQHVGVNGDRAFSHSIIGTLDLPWSHSITGTLDLPWFGRPLQDAQRPLSHGQPSQEQAYRMQTSRGFWLSSVLQKIEPGAPSGTPFAKCPMDVKYWEMWLLKIPGNKTSAQQLSNGHAPHSVKQKPSAAVGWSRGIAHQQPPPLPAPHLLRPPLWGTGLLSCGWRAGRLQRRVNTPVADRGQCCTSAKAHARPPHKTT